MQIETSGLSGLGRGRQGSSAPMALPEQLNLARPALPGAPRPSGPPMAGGRGERTLRGRPHNDHRPRPPSGSGWPTGVDGLRCLHLRATRSLVCCLAACSPAVQSAHRRPRALDENVGAELGGRLTTIQQ